MVLITSSARSDTLAVTCSGTTVYIDGLVTVCTVDKKAHGGRKQAQIFNYLILQHKQVFPRIRFLD